MGKGIKPGLLEMSIGEEWQGWEVRPVAQLKCIYTTACSMGNKQNLEAVVWQANYDLIVITEAQ